MVIAGDIPRTRPFGSSLREARGRVPDPRLVRCHEPAPTVAAGTAENAALHRIMIVRMRRHQPIVDDVTRRAIRDGLGHRAGPVRPVGVRRIIMTNRTRQLDAQTRGKGGTLMSSTLEGRTVLVTGGNGGIGLAMAQACAAAGARIVIWGRNVEKNEVALEVLRSHGATAHALVCDVSDEGATEASFERSIELAGGRIDSVFANAAQYGVRRPFVEQRLDEWRATMSTNLDGVFLTFRAAARHMIDSGGGALVAISSTSAVHGAAGSDAYGASKTALLGLVRSLAVGLARHRIRVNALLPGWTDTDMATGDERFRSVTSGRTPVRRWATPDEYGPVAVYLADPTVTFHTGDSVTVDGGYTVF